MKLKELDNLVPRVLKLFGQRLIARRDSGEFEKIKYFDWLPRTASIVLPKKSCGNKIPVSQSLKK